MILFVFHEMRPLSRSGNLWTAKWWSYGDVPGGNKWFYVFNRATVLMCDIGVAGDWTDDGACHALTPEQLVGPEVGGVLVVEWVVVVE